MKKPFVTLLFCIRLGRLLTCQAASFRSNGPVVTVTLKDAHGGEHKWMDLKALCPNLHWSFSSEKPLPNWLPSLESLQGTVAYHYDQIAARKHKTKPTLMEAKATFTAPHGISVDVVPSLQSESWGLSVQLSKGPGSIMAQFQETTVAFLRGCYQFDLNLPQLSAVRLTPSWDCVKREPACLMEATTGSQRTKTVLNLQHQNPTLTVVHALDERNTIAPEISLYNARIVYKWNVRLNNGQIQTQVDPTECVRVTWIDFSPTGKWVTRVRLPLAGTTRSALQADIQVQRQFTF